MALKITRPQGTEDITPENISKWYTVEQVARDTAKCFGFHEMRIPTFESTDLFLRSVGETTDVVQKEMYTVKAKETEFTLRPEGTAGTIRSMLQNGMLNAALPQKVFYILSCFRHERPQAGRLREFHQFGVEMAGSADAAADAEIISLAKSILDRIGLKNIQLYINSIGCPTCRANYHKALRAYFAAYEDDLCDTCKSRLEKNPMRILDCKSPICSKIAADAPIILDYLCDECSEHFQTLQSHLKALQIDFTINPKIVRGLDYYTKTVFEFKTETIGAQGTVCGGGRYDGLVELMGGQKQPAVGFGMGLERLKLVMEACGAPMPEEPRCDIALIPLGARASVRCSAMAADLRTDGFYAETDLMNRSLKAQLKYANKIGARYTMVIGDSELEAGKARLKDMDSGEEQEVAFDRLADVLMEKEASRLYGEIADAQFGLEELSGVLGQE